MIDLDKRLSACASLVKGPVLADIGTDHAFVPIHLVKRGVCSRAVAADINKGPAARALRHVEEQGLTEKIQVLCADGLKNRAFLPCSDIVIAGMGGELIAQIIDQSLFAKRAGVRFVLQPMTKAERLRQYLWLHGYEITNELIAYDDKRAGTHIYQIIGCSYTGEKRPYTNLELLIGVHKSCDSKTEMLARQQMQRLIKVIGAKAKAGEAVNNEEQTLKALDSFLGF